MGRLSVEGTLLSALQELGKVFGETRVMTAAGQALQGAARTKAAVDENVASVLGLAGLPSKADIAALRRQLDVMQVTLANVSRKLDRLLEEAAEQNEPHPGTKRRRKAKPAATRS